MVTYTGNDQNGPKPKRPKRMSKTAHVTSPKRPLLGRFGWPFRSSKKRPNSFGLVTWAVFDIRVGRFGHFPCTLHGHPKRPTQRSKTANFKIVSHRITLYAPHSYKKHTSNNCGLWAVLVWAVLVMAVGHFGHRCGPFWICQKLVGRFGLGPFWFWYRPTYITPLMRSGKKYV